MPEIATSHVTAPGPAGFSGRLYGPDGALLTGLVPQPYMPASTDQGLAPVGQRGEALVQLYRGGELVDERRP